MSIPPNSLYDFGPQAPGVLSAPRLAAAPGPAPTGPVNPAVAGIHVPLWLLGAVGAWLLFMRPGRRRNPGKRWDYEYGPRYGERLPARYRNPGERRRSRRAATAAFQRRLFLFDRGKPRRAPAEDARNRRQRHRERGFEARAYRADREAGF